MLPAVELTGILVLALDLVTAAASMDGKSQCNFY